MPFSPRNKETLPLDMERDPIDKAIWDEELDAFLPGKVFDFHVHLWDNSLRQDPSAPQPRPRPDVDVASLRTFWAELFPGREMRFMLLPTPAADVDQDAHNRWMLEQGKLAPESLFAMLATPSTSTQYAETAIRTHGVSAFKPYRVFGSDPDEGGIRDYLPERLIEVAHHFGLAIMLHMSKRAGPADPENLADLEDFTRRYPRAQWVLAHCARGFNSFFLEKALPRLKDLPNIWYDTSAVNDLYSHILLLKHEERRRIMYGSDGVFAGGMRGKYVTYARAWEFYGGNPELTHCDPAATFVVYEQLRQQRQAADLLGLTADEISDLFHRNAERLVGSLRAGGQ